MVVIMIVMATNTLSTGKNPNAQITGSRAPYIKTRASFFQNAVAKNTEAGIYRISCIIVTHHFFDIVNTKNNNKTNRCGIVAPVRGNYAPLQLNYAPLQRNRRPLRENYRLDPSN